MKPLTPEQTARRKERDAARYLRQKASRPPTIKKKPGPVAKVAKPAVFNPPLVVRRGPGPAYLPGPPVPTERTRYTVGAPMPQPTRSNTHSMT